MTAIDFAQIPAGELALIVAALGVAGLIAGLLAGLLGVGGGIVVVPVLFQTLSILGVDESLRMPLAVGTSLAAIVPTSIRSASGHYAKGALDWPILKASAPWVFVGAAFGVWLAGQIGAKGLTGVFACGAGALALYMAVGRESWRVADEWPFGIFGGALSAFNGMISAIMGIGGGTFGVSIMTLCGVAIHRAVGTASGLGVTIGIPGTVGMIVNGWNAPHLPPFSLGYVNLVALALVVPAMMVSTPWGVAMAHNMSRKRLRLAFGIFLGLTAARMAYAYWG